MSLDARLRKAEKYLADSAPKARGVIVIARMFQTEPPYAPLSRAERECVLAEARAKAGAHGQVRVIEWGPRWEAARAALAGAV